MVRGHAFRATSHPRTYVPNKAYCFDVEDQVARLNWEETDWQSLCGRRRLSDGVIN